MSLYLVERKSVVRNLILVLALFVILTSSSILSVSAFAASSPQPAIFPLATYPITLTSPNAQSDGMFGTSAANTGKLAIVGALGETADGYSYAGHAYIYNAVTGKLIQNLTSPNAQSYGFFGGSVAISGKIVIVGAFGETADGNSGAGHVYVYNVATGKLIQTLTSPNAQSDGYFGLSVANSGKLVVVGAPYETANGYSQAGHAYIYNEATGKLIQNLTSPNAQSDGYFGTSVTISGKLVIIGASGETVDGYSLAGHAYVYNAISGKLIQTLTSPNAQSYGQFGQSLAISGKLAIVGACCETADGYSYAGHAYVYNAATGKLLQNLTSPNPQSDGVFGVSVWISGKLAVVGALGETADGYSGAGHAYIFKV